MKYNLDCKNLARKPADNEDIKPNDYETEDKN
jgi:hypothetical protein